MSCSLKASGAAQFTNPYSPSTSGALRLTPFGFAQDRLRTNGLPFVLSQIEGPVLSRSKGVAWSGRANRFDMQVQSVVNAVFEQTLDVTAFFGPLDNRPNLLLGGTAAQA